MLCRSPRVAHRDAHVGDGVPELRRAIGQYLAGAIDILEDIGDRVLVLVAEQLGQTLGQPLNAIDDLRSAIEQSTKATGARRDHGASLGAGLLDRRTPSRRARELNFTHASEADAVDRRGCTLEDRRLLVDLNPHPDELGTARQQRYPGDLADRNAGKGDTRPFVEAADRFRE